MLLRAFYYDATDFIAIDADAFDIFTPTLRRLSLIVFIALSRRFRISFGIAAGFRCYAFSRHFRHADIAPSAFASRILPDISPSRAYHDYACRVCCHFDTPDAGCRRQAFAAASERWHCEQPFRATRLLRQMARQNSHASRFHFSRCRQR